MDRGRASVDLYWLPLGAGDNTHCVRTNGLIFEWLAARRGRRERSDLYHAALEVTLGPDRYTIEMGPVWGTRDPDRGVVVQGPVGLRWLGRSRYFRYEVRCWRNGSIPDIAEAVGGPRRLSSDPLRAERLLAVAPAFPNATWGRDELGAGEMWNSNSLVAWLLARSDHDMRSIGPPEHGRAPGWSAGLVVAARNRSGRPEDTEFRARTGGMPRPAGLRLRQVGEVAAALPWFGVAPLTRRWHLRWGATDGEVARRMPGDDLLPVSHFTATRAVTVDAPPESVWPWLCQVGFARGGFYSYDLLDALGTPSARTILPQWQGLGVGDVVAPMTDPASPATCFVIAEMSPPLTMVWKKPDSTWAWRLTPLSGGRTRLVTRLKQRYRPGLSAVLTVPLLELGDFPMMRRMLLGIKARAEASARSDSPRPLGVPSRGPR